MDDYFMNQYVIVGLVFFACTLLVIYTQINSTVKSDQASLKERLQKEFSAYKVIERNQNIIICRNTLNHHFDEELVLIRIDANQPKNRRTSGQTLIVTYAKQPSLREIKKDIAAHLS